MRLIDADKLVEAIKEKCTHNLSEDTRNGLCGAVAIICEQPTVDIERLKTRLK